MLGMILLTAVGIYVLIAVVTALVLTRVSRVKSVGARAAVAVGVLTVFGLIPTYDVILGKWEWERLCETQAGIRVYQPIYLGPEWWREDGTLVFFDEHGNFLEKCPGFKYPHVTGICASKQLPYLFKSNREKFVIG